MTDYVALTFCPIQSFIEKSRKLRDLYGSSQILSYLTRAIITKVTEDYETYATVISPGLPRVQQGMPNRILIKINTEVASKSSEIIIQELHTEFLNQWKKILIKCREWVENALQDCYQTSEWGWYRSWEKWKKHTWEFFGGIGHDPSSAMLDLEQRKLARNWTGVNWVGESSSLSGTDAIAWYGMDREKQNVKQINWGNEAENIKLFYRRLAFILDGVNNPDEQPNERQPEGKYIDANERLNIPELTKRLITLWEDIARPLGVELPSELRHRGFRDLVRRPQDNPAKVGQETGWFMGDGDRVGDYLKQLNSEQEVYQFSEVMLNWGQWFQQDFRTQNIGRVIYAGGDDFLGIIYNRNFPQRQLTSIPVQQAFNWLKALRQKWEENKTPEINENVTLSVGFVWAGHSIPQRDILQHCREAEQKSKQLGRDRITIRILFNNGQYVQWTTPWQYLTILDHYCDRDGGKNWGHIYSDLEQLKARHAFCLGYIKKLRIKPDGREILESYPGILDFFDQYFPGYGNILDSQRRTIINLRNADNKDYAWAMIHWIDDLIKVGWHLSEKKENMSTPADSLTELGESLAG